MVTWLSVLPNQIDFASWTTESWCSGDFEQQYTRQINNLETKCSSLVIGENALNASSLFTSWKRKIMENRWSIFGNRREQNFKSKAELQEVQKIAEAWKWWKCSEACEALWFLWSGIADPNLILATFAIAAERQLLRAAQNCHAWIRVHMVSHAWFHWVSDGPLKSNWKVLKTKCCTQKWVDKWT